MNRKHSTRESAERMLRSAVEAETPDVRAKIMASLRDRGQETSRFARPERGRRVWKYAAALAVAALTVTGAFALPRNSVTSEPAASVGGTASGSRSAEASAMKNPFVIEAYAAEKAGGEKLNKTAGISLLRPVSITGIDLTRFSSAENGGSFYNDLNLLHKENGTQLYAKYVGFNLKCVGKNIKSVTFTADRGGFAQVVNLNSEKYGGIKPVSPYAAEQERKNFEKNKDSILKKDPNYKPSQPTPNYGDGKSVEEGASWENDKEHMESYGYLPVGASYTIGYADQDDYTKQYACRLPITYTDKEVAAMNQISMKEIFHRAAKAMDGTVVTVTANYEDGTNASKPCVLKLDPETWVFHAVEK